MSGIVELRDDEVHVWRAALHPSATATSLYWNALSDEERRRAERFRFSHHRRQFVASHGILRLLLARYTGRAPEGLQFEFSPEGKPALKNAAGLQFNMAHSRDLAVYALARDRQVGIDVEWIDRARDVLPIASRFFSEAEEAAILALPPELQTIGFYTCWTRKEAYVKARGEGLSLDLRSFSVSLDPHHPVLLEAPDDVQGGRPWTLGTLELDACYCGAYAIERAVNQTLFFEWEHE